MSPRLRVAALSIAVFAACDSPVEPFHPQGQGDLVPVGPLIEDAISGGVDRHYSFNVAIDGEYVVYLKSLSGFVTLGVSDPFTGFTVASAFSNPGTTPLDQNPSSNFLTPLGGVLYITAHVIGGDSARLQFKIYSVRRAPELAMSRFNWGDTVVELIDPAVDADVFTAHGDSGLTVAAVIEPLGPEAGELTFFSVNANGYDVGLVTATPGQALRTSYPATLPLSQDYRFAVRATGSPRHGGTYRFWTLVRNRAPEHIAAVLPLHTVVTGERMDNAIDVDDFTFQDTTGAEFAALVEGARPSLVLVSSATDSVLASTADDGADTTLFHHGTQAFRLATGGTYKLSVQSNPDAPLQAADTGRYRIMLFRVNRAPEVAAAAVAVGDTIRSESLAPAGDIDEFTVTAAPSTPLTLSFRLTSNSIPQGGSVTFDVINASTGESMTQAAVGVALPFMQLPFTVPAGGAVKLRIAPTPVGAGVAVPYEFVVK